MQASWHAAPDRLKSLLSGIWTIETDAATDLSATVLPDGTPYIVFQKDGTRLKSSDNDGQFWSSVCLSGPRSTQFAVELGASSQIFIVQLSSTGGVPLLGLPMSEVTDQCINLDSVVDSNFDLNRISDALMGEKDDVKCVDMLQRWVGARAAHQRNEQACEIIQEVRQKNGDCRVSKMAAKSQLSRRHLSRLVNREVGLSAKLFARIMRFDRAVQLARVRPKLRLIEIASAAGYADQAHMTREFTALGGIRPSDIQSERGAMIW
ncbi:MAG: helix-turn-helix domain-containing protein [Planctomycetota bacterium]